MSKYINLICLILWSVCGICNIFKPNSITIACMTIGLIVSYLELFLSDLNEEKYDKE